MLEKLISINADLAGVVTSNDKGLNSDFADLEEICKQENIPVIKTNNINDNDSVDWLREKNPDVIFCFGWSQLIRKSVLDIPDGGVIGYHPSALPKNRGRHPLIWALVLGLSETASTFFMMDSGADSGDILSQVKVNIDDTDTASTLYKKITGVAEVQLELLVAGLAEGSIQQKPQNHELANIWRKRDVRDGEIDWRMSAVNIYNLVRGLTHPYVGASFRFNENEVKLWKSKILLSNEFSNIEAGKIVSISTEGNPIVKCGDDCLELMEVEPNILFQLGDYL